MPHFGVTRADARSIASVLSGNLAVNIKEGDEWAFDHNTQMIKYRPEDLTVLTETEVVANLLHECGHAKYTTHPVKITTHTSLEHKKKWMFFANVPEDFRVEDLIRKFYPYALDYLPEYSFKSRWILNEAQKTFTAAGSVVPKFIKFTVAMYSHITGEVFETDADVMDKVSTYGKYMEAARFTENSQEVYDVLRNIYDDEKVQKWLDDWQEPEPLKIGLKLSGNPKINYPTYSDLLHDVKTYIPNATKTLARVLTDNKFDKFQGKFRTGARIYQRKLFKFATGDFKLFQRRIEAKSKDYVFGLLVDESGSMRGESVVNAARGAVLFSHVLNRLNIQYGVWGFNHQLRYYKTINQPFGTKHHEAYEKMMRNTMTEDASWNCDGWAVKSVTGTMLHHGSRRVLFVLSDGEPAPEDPHRHDLRSEVKRAMAAGVEVVGFGIGGHRNVREYYPTSVIVDNVSEIPNAITRVLRNKLRIKVA